MILEISHPDFFHKKLLQPSLDLNDPEQISEFLEVEEESGLSEGLNSIPAIPYCSTNFVDVNLPWPFKTGHIYFERNGDYYTGRVGLETRRDCSFRGFSKALEDFAKEFWISINQDGVGYFKNEQDILEISVIAPERKNFKNYLRFICIGGRGAVEKRFGTEMDFVEDISKLESITNSYCKVFSDWIHREKGRRPTYANDKTFYLSNM